MECPDTRANWSDHYQTVLYIPMRTPHQPILVKHFVLKGWSKPALKQALVPYFHRRNDLTIQNGCIICDIRAVIPIVFQSKLYKMWWDNTIVQCLCLRTGSLLIFTAISLALTVNRQVSLPVPTRWHLCFHDSVYQNRGLVQLANVSISKHFAQMFNSILQKVAFLFA